MSYLIAAKVGEVGDKLFPTGYARGAAAESMLTASAGGVSAGIGDVLDSVQSGVSDMVDAVADFASERTGIAKDALVGVKDVAAEAGDKAIDTGVEL